MRAAALWRRWPVRGPGRLVSATLRWHARKERLVAAGPGGIRILIDPMNPPETSIYLWGTYEPEVVAALERLLGTEGIAVDVGANCGVLTVYMASRLTAGRVVAVDPSDPACARVRAQAVLNGLNNVEVQVCALGHSGSRSTYSPGRIGIGALPAEDADLTTGERSEVPVRTLDDVLADAGTGRVELIKVDTDGAEVDVLLGAERLLRSDSPSLIFEVFVEGLARRGATVAQLGELLIRHEYDLFAPVLRNRPRWLAGPSKLEGFVAIGPEGLTAGGNFVAVSRRSTSYIDRRRRLLT